MRRRGLRTVTAVAGLAAVLAVGVVSPEATEAAWTDAEYAQGSAVTAGVLPAPSATACHATSVLLLGLQSVRLTWSASQPGGQQVRISRGTVTGTDVQGTPGSMITQTGKTGELFHYEAVYPTEKLLGLINLSDLLGGSYTIQIRNGFPGSSWTSAPTTYHLNVVLLSLGTTCSLVPA